MSDEIKGSNPPWKARLFWTKITHSKNLIITHLKRVFSAKKNIICPWKYL